MKTLISSPFFETACLIFSGYLLVLIALAILF